MLQILIAGNMAVLVVDLFKPVQVMNSTEKVWFCSIKEFKQFQSWVRFPRPVRGSLTRGMFQMADPNRVADEPVQDKIKGSDQDEKESQGYKLKERGVSRDQGHVDRYQG